MTRSALLIVCPGDVGQQGYLPGTIVDGGNYRNFLYSQSGGDWYGYEIEVLTNPTINQVKDKIKAISSDYSFVVFSGHGGIGDRDGKMYVDVNGSDLYIGELKTQSNKQTLILDTCRSIFPQIKNELKLHSLTEKAVKLVSNSRQEFENHLSNCEEGIIIIYSCKPGQASGDNAKVGGVFSSSLIKTGIIWGESAGTTAVLDVQKAFEGGVRLMNETFVTLQVPEFEGGRRRNYFPFAIRNVNL